jgi:SNF2 family DNA or RNA helicase
MANHIIFVAPYLTSGSSAQQLYDAARIQAIGRADRFGQKKVVQVYDFVTKHTIDVDILEKRNDGMLLKEYESPESDPVTAVIGHRLEKVELGEQSTFGSRLSHKIFLLDDDY